MSEQHEFDFDLKDRLAAAEFLLEEHGVKDDLKTVTQFYQLRRQPRRAFVTLDSDVSSMESLGDIEQTLIGYAVFEEPFSDEHALREYLTTHLSIGRDYRPDVELRRSQAGNSLIASVEGVAIVLYGALPFVSTAGTATSSSSADDNGSDDDIPF